MSFDEISKMTDEKASILIFTMGDVEKILLPGQILTSSISTQETIQQMEQRLLALQQKGVRMELHAQTLSEYYRYCRIPRGLRIQKEPTIGQDDSEFSKKWCEILNHCSMNLMLLIIEYTKKETKSLSEKIENHKMEMNHKFDKKQLDDLQRPMEEKLDKFRMELLNVKIHKFKRDTMDYKDHKVYTWMSERSKPHQQQGGLRFTSASESDDSYTSSSQITSRQRKPFLGQPRRSKRNQNGRNQREEGIGEKDFGREVISSECTVSNNQDNIVFNLSDKELSTEQTTVLSKGLSFVPHNVSNPFMVKVELFKFFRNVKLRSFF